MKLMLRRGRCVQLAIAGLLMVAVPAGGQEASDTLKVFFLGNSYVYFNNLPGLVEGISDELPGPRIRAESHTHGGYSLRRHMGDGHFAEAIDTVAAEKAWDAIVLQEQSALGTPLMDSISGKLGSSRGFHEAVRGLVPNIHQTGADAVLYMTWAKKRWPDQISDLQEAYGSVGVELGIPVAPVGTAWDLALRRRPDLDLHLGDGSHPTPTGSYLAACVLYATLTGRSPVGAPREVEGLPWNYSGVMASDRPTVLVTLPAEDAEFLQHLAWEVVTGEGSN